MAERTSDNTGGAAASPPGPQAWAGVFASLLSEQWGALQTLDALSRAQRALIAGESPDELVALMDERQAVVNRLVALTAKLTPMQTRWDEGRGMLPAGVRHDVEARLSALAALAREISARDAEDQELLARRKKEIADELSQSSGGQRAMHAYAGTHGGPGAVFQDREA